MAQQRLRDFFKVKNTETNRESYSDQNCNENQNLDKADTISFHSFTVHKSTDAKTTACHSDTLGMHASSLPDIRPDQVKPSDFAKTTWGSKQGSSAIAGAHTTDTVNRPQTRHPFGQLQQKHAAAKNKEIKLDEYFKSVLVVDKVASQ